MLLRLFCMDMNTGVPWDLACPLVRSGHKTFENHWAREINALTCMHLFLDSHRQGRRLTQALQHKLVFSQHTSQHSFITWSKQFLFSFILLHIDVGVAPMVLEGWLTQTRTERAKASDCLYTLRRQLTHSTWWKDEPLLSGSWMCGKGDAKLVVQQFMDQQKSQTQHFCNS